MNSNKIQAKVQKFGATLSAMVMPNVGVFIGWGVLAALFIDTGWMPNAYWNVLVGPILKYLLPTLIGYTAGSNVYGRRGGVIGAFATMGCVIGAEVTMLVGGMIMGPLAAWLLKKFDKAVEGKVRPGLEMLVDNFSLGLIGVALCMIAYAGVAPAMTAITNVLSVGVQFLTDHNLLLLTPFFVQPAQILFLNNAVNHGILVPLGIQQTAEVGKSVLFLIEANGAYWVGLVAAFAVFGKGMSKKSAPGAVIIQFFGGIAETCFPYCLSMPLTILGPIAGNVFALFILTTLDGGAIGPPSPGSVFAYYMMTPKSCLVPNTIAYFGSMVVSFVVTSVILKFSNQSDDMMEEDSGVTAVGGADMEALPVQNGTLKKLDKVIFACDAGMGSSAMGVSILRTRLQKAAMYPKIEHVAVAEIPSDADVVVTNVNLAERARMTTEGKVPILTISNFMDQGQYDRIVKQMKTMLEEGASVPDTHVEKMAEIEADVSKQDLPVFDEKNIIMNASFNNKAEAIDACADLLIGRGYADESYRQDMHKRDEEASVYLGEGVALPHGLAQSKKTIKNSGICFIQVPGGVDFDGEKAYLLFGVAGKGEEHIDLLGKIGTLLTEEETLIEKLKAAGSKDEVMKLLEL